MVAEKVWRRDGEAGADARIDISESLSSWLWRRALLTKSAGSYLLELPRAAAGS